MRIIATPDGAVNRHDRALWQTPPFDFLLWIIIVPACRKYTVPADNRVYAVASESRIFSVLADDRVHSVAAASRVFAVPEDSRIYEVTCG